MRIERIHRFSTLPLNFACTAVIGIHCAATYSMFGVRHFLGLSLTGFSCIFYFEFDEVEHYLALENHKRRSCSANKVWTPPLPSPLSYFCLGKMLYLRSGQVCMESENVWMLVLSDKRLCCQLYFFLDGSFSWSESVSESREDIAQSAFSCWMM